MHPESSGVHCGWSRMGWGEKRGVLISGGHAGVGIVSDLVGSSEDPAFSRSELGALGDVELSRATIGLVLYKSPLCCDI